MLRALRPRAAVWLPVQVRCAAFHTTPIRRNDQPEEEQEQGFEPRQTFDLPSTTPSWFAGHMARAIRSMPYLLARYPPPLVIEARDARLPLTSINPVFESILRKAPTANDGLDELTADPTDDAESGHSIAAKSAAAEVSTWRSRRLIVYLKRDLIDPKLEAPILDAMAKKDPYQTVLFVNTRIDSDVKRVTQWVQKQALKIAADSSIATPPKKLTEVAEKRAKKGLSGAFRHTPTPDEGIRLLILGMPNVGKSSLLNSLRKVGTGKGKAASTAPHPGHTRKLTGTVRISREGPEKATPLPKNAKQRAAVLREMRKENRASADNFAEDSFELSTDEDGEVAPNASPKKEKPKGPPIYVYDTPGVMVPFLGHGSFGAERGIKLAITAGIKDSLFDVQLLADYLLYRLNNRPLPAQTDESGKPTLVNYAQNLPLPADYLQMTAGTQGRTNSTEDFLWYLASRAPGSLKKGNVRDLDQAALFMLHHWRIGKLDPNTELDLNTTDPDVVRRRVGDFLNGVVSSDDPAQAAHTQEFVDANDPDSKAYAQKNAEKAAPSVTPDYGAESKTQAKKAEQRRAVLRRKHKLLDKRAAAKRGAAPSRGPKAPRASSSRPKARK